MRLAPLAFAVAVAWPAWAEPEPPNPRAAEQGISTFALENGLTGVVIEDHRAPVVTHMVWYHVGAADDPPGLSGLAHYLEHLMFKGTDTLGEGEFSRIVSENGGEDNAFTSFDYTGYFQRIAADRLGLVMEMEADRMDGIDPQGWEAERAVVMEERRQVVENRPGAVFNEQRRAAQYLNHPYGRPVIGWMHEIAGLTRDDALAFHAEHYAPNNAVLVVAGDVAPAEVEALAREHYGPIPADPDLEPRARLEEPPHLAARRVEYRDPRVQNPYVLRTYQAEPRRAGDQAEAAALTVLAELLGGGGITSVFSQALLVEDDFALDAGAFYSDVSLDETSFGVYVTPRPGTDLAEAEARLDAVVAAFLANGPDPEQLERVKTGLRADQIYARDNIQGRAREIGSALTSGLTLDDVLAWPDALAAVTAEDVMAAAERVFRPETSVTGWLMSAEPAAAAAGALAAEPIEDEEALSQ